MTAFNYAGTCGMAGSIDNSPANGRWTNFSFGEIGADVSTAYYKDFITDGLNGRYAFTLLGAAAVPEPSTWLSMIMGFAMIGSAFRRRRATTARASPALNGPGHMA